MTALYIAAVVALCMAPTGVLLWFTREKQMNKMNSKIKARWVAALRSGEYKQGDRRVLNDGQGGFCCLGVLCDLYAKDTGTEWEWTPANDAMRLRLAVGNTFYPAQTVRDWADFHEDEKRVRIEGRLESVAAHNDGVDVTRRTFAEIADAIEAQL